MSNYVLKNIPLYRGKIMIVISDNIDYIQSLEPDFPENKEIYAHTISSTHKEWQCIKLIFNFKNKDRKVYHGCVAHEALHASNMILEDRGFIFDGINDEPLAYLIEWITDQCYKFFTKNGIYPELNRTL